MIGSCTLIIKDNGSYRVHILGGIILGDVTPAELKKVDDDYKDKPDAVLTSEQEVFEILSSHQCASEDQPHYSKFAGDRKWFLDLSSQTLLSVEDFVKNWETIHQAKLEAEKLALEKRVKRKNQRHAAFLRKNGKECLDKLTAVVLNPPEKQDVTFGKVMSNTPRFYFGYSHVLGSIQFFEPKIDEEYFNTEEFFVNYLRENGWDLMVFKTKYTHSQNPRISQIFATKDGKSLAWDCDSHINLTTEVEITSKN